MKKIEGIYADVLKLDSSKVYHIKVEWLKANGKEFSFEFLDGPLSEAQLILNVDMEKETEHLSYEHEEKEN